jgi:hypothetical protein
VGRGFSTDVGDRRIVLEITRIGSSGLNSFEVERISWVNFADWNKLREIGAAGCSAVAVGDESFPVIVVPVVV